MKFLLITPKKARAKNIIRKFREVITMKGKKLTCIFCKESEIHIKKKEMHYYCSKCQSYFRINSTNPIYIEIYAYPEKKMRMHFEMQKIRLYFDKD